MLQLNYAYLLCVFFTSVKLLKRCSASRQRIAELEQRLEKVTEENEHLSEQLERRDIQVFAWRSVSPFCRFAVL